MADSPVCYFVLAGQSNVLGQASITHLEDRILDGVEDLQRFEDDSGFVERDDAFVTFLREYGDEQDQLEGRLSADLYGGSVDTFGPEAGFGFEIADNLDQDVVFLKAAGVGALSGEWIPPSSNGGFGGDFYNSMLADITESINRVDTITGSVGQEAELCGIVWWHGYADVFDDDSRAAYQTNLENWIADVRNDLGIPDLSIVIGGMGGAGTAASDEELEMREIQLNVVADTDNTIFSDTAQFVTDDVRNDPQCPDASPDEFHYFCDAEVMVDIGVQFARDMLTLIDSSQVDTPAPGPADTAAPTAQPSSPPTNGIGGDVDTASPTGTPTASPSLSSQPTAEGDTPAPTFIVTLFTPTPTTAEPTSGVGEMTISPTGEFGNFTLFPTDAPTRLPFRGRGKGNKKSKKSSKKSKSSKSSKSSKKSSKKGKGGGKGHELKRRPRPEFSTSSSKKKISKKSKKSSKRRLNTNLVV